jgi:hypothetical protein
MNLTKEIKATAMKIVKKEIGEDTKGWKRHPCSWIGRIIIVKIIVQTKAIYKSNAIS